MLINLDRKFHKYVISIIPTIFIISGLTFTYFLKHTFNRIEAEVIDRQSRFAANELSRNITQLITERAQILERISKIHPSIFPGDNKRFNEVAKIVLDSEADLYGINWIDPDGYIRWVSPQVRNEVARNKRVYDRLEIRQYMVTARDERKTQLSHIIDLYQGPKGIILYVPIFDNGVFRGWYNGVINVEETFTKFFQERGLNTLNFFISIKGHKETYIFKKWIKDTIKKELTFDVPVLNQIFTVKVAFDKNSMTAQRGDQLLKVFIAIYVSIIVIAIFLFYLIRAQFKVTDLNRKLTRDRTLISILSHDMATPLTLVRENIKRLKEKLKDSYPEVDRILKSSEKQMSLLTRVRSFHARNLGTIHIELYPVNVSEMIDEALSEFDENLKEKDIKCEVTHVNGEIYCLTDRLTAVDNVLGNVISNAIKFSNPGGTIYIKSYLKNQFVVIEVQYHGAGIKKDVLDHIFDEKHRSSRPGTRGETGTGLGMLQVKAFMEYYKGDVKIDTSDSGTRILLYFKKTRI